MLMTLLVVTRAELGDGGHGKEVGLLRCWSRRICQVLWWLLARFA
jgi:hypothetical protein